MHVHNFILLHLLENVLQIVLEHVLHRFPPFNQFLRCYKPQCFSSKIQQHIVHLQVHTPATRGKNSKVQYSSSSPSLHVI